MANASKIQAGSVHPLSQRHYERVGRLPFTVGERLADVIAVRFGLRDQRLIRPLGHVPVTALMTRLGPDPRNPARRRVEYTLAVVTGVYDEKNHEVTWSRVRGCYDFRAQPRVSRDGRRAPHILDPRDEAPTGQRAQGAMVRTGLAMFEEALRRNAKSHLLDTAPAMPAVLFGYADPSSAEFEVTEDLVQSMADESGVTPDSIRGLPGLESLARAHWLSRFVAPGHGANDTGLWLLDMRFTTHSRGVSAMFEDFAAVCGDVVPNMADEIGSVEIPNPAEAVASSLGIDLPAVRRAFAGEAAERIVEHGDPHDATPADAADGRADMTPTEFLSAAGDAGDAVLDVAAEIHRQLGLAAELFSADQVAAAVLDGRPRLRADVPAASVSSEAAVFTLRQLLRGEHRPEAEFVTDDELRSAIAHPDTAMRVAAMPRPQVVYVGDRDLPEAARFSSAELGRAGIRVDLWPEGHRFYPKLDRGSREGAANTLAESRV